MKNSYSDILINTNDNSNITILEYDNRVTSEELNTQEIVDKLNRGVNAFYLDEENAGYPQVVNNLVEEYKNSINTVEDLVRLSIEVNSGLEDYLNKELILENDIDFDDDNSYINPNSTDFGDFNNDGVIEGIKKEVTEGKRF